ncbi:hypothetical protein AC1031_019357 [Aphanomyces cochlioides]|nr:hypothetical protein AC1031_019357 [Aphanomyces cochlioides]
MGCSQSNPSMSISFPSLPGYSQQASSSANTVHIIAPRSSSTERNRLSFKRSSTIKDKPLAQVKYPCQTSTWIRGKPIAVQWTVMDPTVPFVKIELCQLGSNATTLVSASAPNSGYYYYGKVPWGLIGDGFFIRIQELNVDGDVAPRQALSETFRVGNERLNSSCSEGSVTPVSSIKSSSTTSIHGMVTPARWHENSFQTTVTPVMASCY